MSKSILKNYLKKYSTTRISKITGINVEILTLLRQDKVPYYITMLPDGTYMPSYLTVINKLKSKMKQFEKNK